MKMRPYTREEEDFINSLIKQGESIHGKTDAMGHLVVEFVQKEMLRLGKRVKFPTPKNVNPFPK